jgi:hypothetical protein
LLWRETGVEVLSQLGEAGLEGFPLREGERGSAKGCAYLVDRRFSEKFKG